MPASLEHRIGKLEAALAKIPLSPESGGRVDLDVLNQGLIQLMENIRQLAEHPDPFIRLKYRREQIHKAEQELATGTKDKADPGPAFAKVCLPKNYHATRDAELEILERAGFDTGELRAKHQQHAANQYKWPYRDNPLPSEAQIILDHFIACDTTEPA